MSARHPYISGIMGGVIGSVMVAVLTRWLGALWGCLVFLVLWAVFCAALELWYRVIWPVDALKPELPIWWDRSVWYRTYREGGFDGYRTLGGRRLPCDTLLRRKGRL